LSIREKKEFGPPLKKFWVRPWGVHMRVDRGGTGGHIPTPRQKILQFARVFEPKNSKKFESKIFHTKIL